MLAHQRAADDPAALGADALQITRVADLDAFLALQAEWDALVERSEGATVFQTWGWLLSWWQAFGEGAELCILLARQGAELVGIAPLVSSRRGILGRRRRVIEFLGIRAADYLDLIAPPGRLDARLALLRWLAEHARRWDLVLLDDIPAVSATLEACRMVWGAYGSRLVVQPLCKAVKLCLADPECGRRALHTNRLHRSFNGLKHLGQLDWRCYADDEAEPYLDAFFAQHIKRWGATETPSFFGDPRYRAFYRALAHNLAPTARACLAVTLLDDAPIAFDWGYAFRGSLMLHTRSHDYPQGSPGSVALRYWIIHAMEHGLAEVDLGRGEEPYKTALTNAVVENEAVHVYRRALDRWADDLAISIIARIERLPDQAPARRLLRRLRDRTWGTLG